jgi:quercetin dioxygenase-like cupin family protein
MEKSELEKGKALIVVKAIEYVPNSVVVKTIMKKTAGNISTASFDAGKELSKKTIQFDTFIQIIDGKAEILIDGESNLLDTGQSIIIPARTSRIIKANERFKMISTIINIKSGYE